MDKRFADRCDELIKMGLKYDGESFIMGDINVHWTEISCETEESWKELIGKIKAEMKRREAVA